MSKTLDDKHDAAIRPVVADAVPAPRMRRIPAVVDDAGLDTITTATVLKLATLGIAGRITPELMGRAMTCIAREWCQDEATRLSAEMARAKGGAT